MHTHSNSIQNGPKLEATQMSINSGIINKVWYIHGMKYHSTIKRNEVPIYSATWINLGNMLNGRSQTQRVIYYMILFI